MGIRLTLNLFCDICDQFNAFFIGFAEKHVPADLDTIVIGSGGGGLATANILARSGQKVLVLEQHDQAGGCMHSFIEDGFEFDVGECILM